MDAILRRILTRIGAPGLVDALGALPGSDLQSLLLAVARARATSVTPAALLAATDRALVRPAGVDARRLHEIDGVALAAAAGFDAVELAPVAPFAIDAVLGGISPNNVLPAIRPVQVLADPTSPLALEAARRRRADRAGVVRLCTSARLVRLQPLDNPDFTPHFRLFALVTAGRDAGSHRTELDAVRDHLLVYLRLLRGLRNRGFGIGDVEVVVSDTEVVRGLVAAQGADPAELAAAVHATDADGGAAALATRGIALPRTIDDPARDLAALTTPAARAGRARLAGVAAEVFPAVTAEHPGVRLRLDGGRVAGLAYYQGLTLQLWVTDPTGVPLPLADGGFCDWTQRLLADHKERLLASGIGTELLCKRYAPGARD